MKFAGVTDRLARLGSHKWALHDRAKQMAAEGRDVIRLTVGEPDLPTPPELVATLTGALARGRTGYSSGRGEAGLLLALAKKYTRRCHREIAPRNILAFPGTQTALYAVMMALAEAGTEVLVGDPNYATYEGVIRATGATPVPVPLRPERGFRLDAADVAARVTPRARVLLLNSPHNPTGAVLTAQDIRALGDLARARDLWIVSDEVYEELIFDAPFASPLDFADLAERTVVASSISKSHAAPGFRSGWCVGSAEFCARLLPLSETMLFGNQPFIADMTAAALNGPSAVAAELRARLSRRADLVVEALDGCAGLAVSRPEAGMFAMLDVRATGLGGFDFASSLLDATGVAVMPGCSFGESLRGWCRLSLTVEDARLAEAMVRIADFAAESGRRKIA
ncbi:MAG: pyridoxal phosphate-dependent aminotransferase [Amaricoccus sp.]|uniref:pyridoxal phosphate-dependent aminotransferase n=1 Tax=Amaricoccus sp. TaxID=1872485 RepID=UPI003315F318